MYRTTIMLPSVLKDRALRYAREHGISFGQLVRDSLACVVEKPKSRKDDPFFKDHAVYRGKTPKDLVANMDHYLYDEEER